MGKLSSVVDKKKHGKQNKTLPHDKAKRTKTGEAQILHEGE